LITQVVPGTPGEKAGLAAGDEALAIAIDIGIGIGIDFCRLFSIAIPIAKDPVVFLFSQKAYGNSSYNALQYTYTFRR